jgi:hypothetical protein
MEEYHCKYPSLVGSKLQEIRRKQEMQSEEDERDEGSSCDDDSQAHATPISQQMRKRKNIGTEEEVSDAESEGSSCDDDSQAHATPISQQMRKRKNIGIQEEASDAESEGSWCDNDSQTRATPISQQMRKQKNIRESDAESEQKKATTPVTVMTFGVPHSIVQVQLLSTHNVHELVDALCSATDIGDGRGVNAHMWNVQLGSKTFESGVHDAESRATQRQLGDLRLNPGTNMTLTYDYGNTSIIKITLLEACCLGVSEEASWFPRRKPMEGPDGYSIFVPPNDADNLNTLFPILNQWAFSGTTASLELNLFQAGRKQNYGYLSCGNSVKHMIYAPAKTHDLGSYLHSFNHACRLTPKTDEGMDSGARYPLYTWYSVVVLPRKNATDKLLRKFGKNLESGFCDLVLAPDYHTNSLNDVFPHVAALAGFGKKKPGASKGWLCYKDGLMTINSGKTLDRNSKRLEGSAWSGEDQHHPVDSPLLQLAIDITSMQELFCVAEGLLRTL